MVWKIESCPLLLEEIELLALANGSQKQADGDAPFCKDNNVSFDRTYDYTTSAQIQTFFLDLPEDANVDGLDRFESDCGFGALVEIVVPRKKVRDFKSLKGKRYAHVDSKAVTSRPLVARTEEMEQEDREDSNVQQMTS
ncbi:MAG TPA: hypothetical protein VER35_02415 [Candidatus Limnocylindrales bacterium]|nr:hypothetical protein [Candidatus Limnocylindrales bacterium]